MVTTDDRSDAQRRAADFYRTILHALREQQQAVVDAEAALTALLLAVSDHLPQAAASYQAHLREANARAAVRRPSGQLLDVLDQLIRDLDPPETRG